MTAPKQYATVARPGVIVSTLTEGDQAQTIVFTTDHRQAVGFTTDVTYGDARDAAADHAGELARVTA